MAGTYPLRNSAKHKQTRKNLTVPNPTTTTIKSYKQLMAINAGFKDQ